MKSFMKSSVYFLSALLIFILYTGCTPGKAQTRDNNYSGKNESEDYEAFDREGSGDEEIPAYDEKKTDNDKEDKYARNDKKRDDRSRRVKSQGDDDSEDSTDDSETKEVSGDDDNDSSDDSAVNEKFYQKGYASWYGREFHGKSTASGEKFDMNRLTAAHKTLPFGTIIEVKNLENGKTVRLKVNDRGPYRGNRIIDLSYGAAKEIGMVKKGQVKVGIKVIKMGDNSASSDDSDSSQDDLEAVSDDDSYESSSDRKNRKVKDEYADEDSDGLRLQAGAFYSRKNAEALKEKIESLTDRPVKIVKDGEFYKVRIEGFKNKKELERLRDALGSENISSFSVE